MSSDFRVGDEVVCINAQPLHGNGPVCKSFLARLKEGDTYVIGDIRPATHHARQLVVGVTGIIAQNGQLYGYDPNRFRKVQKKFTGMSVLRSLLTPQPELVH